MPVDSVLSFRPFYEFLKEKSATEPTVKRAMYTMLLQEVEKYPELLEPVEARSMEKYTSLLEMIYAGMTGITTEENEVYWGMAMPGSGGIFYATDALFNLILQKMAAKVDGTPEDIAENIRRHRAMLYTAILKKCYDYDLHTERDAVLHTRDTATGLLKYYALNIDTSFVEVVTKGSLPSLDFRKMEGSLQEGTLFDYLQDVLPLHLFSFVGFSVCRLTDITSAHAIELIKSTITNISRKEKELCVMQIMESLKVLAGNNLVDFGFIPFVMLNNKPLLEFGEFSNSLILKYGKTGRLAYPDFVGMAETFVKRPVPVFFKDVPETTGMSRPLVELLNDAGAVSFALLPLFYNGEMVGAMEVYSRERHVLNEKMLQRVDPALPHLAQLMKVAIDNVNQQVTAVVSEKFTSIQPSVQWKFNEAAWHYLQAKSSQQKEPEIETVSFKEVYPLYGAIDIRNSSVERNMALQNDLSYHLSLLIETLTSLNQAHHLPLAEEMIFNCRKWLYKINETPIAADEHKLNAFIEAEVLPLLEYFKRLDKTAAAVVNNYLAATDVKEGKTHENRRNLETAMQTINKGISNYLDMMRGELQQLYPCYFEKFRTDGLEYDIYIGQSIAPDKPFNPVYLRNMRLWQLTSMAAIGKLTNELLPQLPRALYTTQLIFINGDPIDISFRNDEKRFDVEGAYNIRYQMIKKRIDKVHVSLTNERLTQPSKIALVYFDKKSADEYVSYIRYLQEQGLLNNDLEYLELEELQGVNGLKALRVGINLD